MNIGILIHLRAMLYGCLFQVSGNDITAVKPDGTLVTAIREGQCATLQLGGERPLTLDPIPRAARLYKEVDGCLKKDEEFESRLEARKEFLDADGWVKSIAQLKKEGYSFDAKGNVIGRPGEAGAAKSSADEMKALKDQIAALQAQVVAKKPKKTASRKKSA